MHKQRAKKIILFLSIFFSSALFADSIMMIAPTAPGTITLSKAGTQLVDYVVLNNTNNQILSNFIINPGFGSGQNAKSAISLLANECIVALTPGSTCTFQVKLTGNIYLPSSFFLSPRVCAYNGAVCSQPESSNRITVYVVP